MRLEVKQGADDALIIDDSYSCDTDSLTIAIDYLCRVAESRRKVVILTDILQSGIAEDVLYSFVADKMAQSGVELFVGIGNKIAQYSTLFTMPSLFFSTTEQLLENLSNIDISGAAVLIKGNRNSRTERISHRLETRILRPMYSFSE